MKLKYLILTVLCLALSIQHLSACSCIRGRLFCEHINQTNDISAFKAVIIKQVDYGWEDDDWGWGYDNQAVYARVLTIYKDDLGLTDTIKLYGNSQEASCDVNVMSRYRLQDTIILSIAQNYRTIVNPDSLSENHYQNKLDLCSTYMLHVKDGMVKGEIHADFVSDYEYENEVFTFSESLFDQSLKDCEFDESASPESHLNPTPFPFENIDLEPLNFENWNLDFLVFPNPVVKGGKLRINPKSPPSNLNIELRLISMKGQVLREEKRAINPLHTMDLEGLDTGIYIVEMKTGDQRLCRKVFVSE